MRSSISSGEVPLKVAIIGCGAVADLYHGPALQLLMQTGTLEVVVLVDPVPSRLECLAKKFPGAQCDRTIEDHTFSKVDFAIVASPPRFHEEHVLKLLGLGVHVFCEKPMAATLEEAKRMVQGARDSNLLLSLGLFRRFFPTSIMIKELIDGKSLGAPISVEWSEGGLFDWPAASPSFFSTKSSSGGVFADMGTHVLDLLIWWFGEPESIEYEDDGMGGLEANARALVKFDDGVEAALRLSRDTSIKTGTLINFEQGTVCFKGASADSLVIETKSSDWVVNGKLHKKPVHRLDGFGDAAPAYGQAFVSQIENFASAVKKRGKLLVSADEAMRVHEWIERGYGVRRLMEMPWFTATETLQAKRLAGEKEA